MSDPLDERNLMKLRTLMLVLALAAGLLAATAGPGTAAPIRKTATCNIQLPNNTCGLSWDQSPPFTPSSHCFVRGKVRARANGEGAHIANREVRVYTSPYTYVDKFVATAKFLPPNTWKDAAVTRLADGQSAVNVTGIFDYAFIPASTTEIKIRVTLTQVC